MTDLPGNARESSDWCLEATPPLSDTRRRDEVAGLIIKIGSCKLTEILFSGGVIGTGGVFGGFEVAEVDSAAIDAKVAPPELFIFAKCDAFEA